MHYLFITPPSRLDVYQGLSNEYAAIEQPVWFSLTTTYLINRNFNVQILDAEAENLTYGQTTEKILAIGSENKLTFPLKMKKIIGKSGVTRSNKFSLSKI